MNFFKAVLSFFEKDAVGTVGLCALACLSVAIIMRFVVKNALRMLDDYMDKVHADDKVLVVYNTVKAIAYVLIAGVLTIVALACLMKICRFPYDNSPWLAWLYFIPMYAVQWFLDANMKALALRMFGLEKTEDEMVGEEIRAKAPKQKVFTKKVKYTLDEEGNEVPIDG